jgi:hypothetical protein
VEELEMDVETKDRVDPKETKVLGSGVSGGGFVCIFRLDFKKGAQVSSWESEQGLMSVRKKALG